MTPLTGMRGYLETLSLHAESLDADTRERYLRSSGTKRERVEHIVGDLLDLARLEGGGESFDAQDVPLEDLVRARARAPRTGRRTERREIRRTSRRARRSSRAIRCGSSRRCRTWRRTRCAIRREAGA